MSNLEDADTWAGGKRSTSFFFNGMTSKRVQIFALNLTLSHLSKKQV
jgi:hypothetical protein